jgi:hypothetical protein
MLNAILFPIHQAESHVQLKKNASDGQDAKASRKQPPADTPFAKIEIVCDGFCWVNPDGAMGMAAILVCGDKTKEVSEGHPAAAGNTNNRSELLAAILGIRHSPNHAR